MLLLVATTPWNFFLLCSGCAYRGKEKESHKQSVAGKNTNKSIKQYTNKSIENKINDTLTNTQTKSHQKVNKKNDKQSQAWPSHAWACHGGGGGGAVENYSGFARRMRSNPKTLILLPPFANKIH